MSPECVIRIGSISCSVFRNTIDTKDGPKEFHTANLQRRYRNDEGNWKTKNTFSLVDLPVAIAVLQRAFEFIASKEADVDSV